MMWESDNKRILGVAILAILCVILVSPTPSVALVEIDDLTGCKVGVYNGTGEMDSSRIALVRMFEWMGATVEEVNASQILGDFLDDCDILVFPGGSENSYTIDLQYMTGVNKIRDFVTNGGSYFGICGGSTYGANTVNLFNGTMTPMNKPGDLIQIITMYTNQSSLGPDLSSYPANFSTMYYASQYFAPNPGVSVHTVARYGPFGVAGMIAFEYGHGTVFLSSPHPEYEEDSDRDDTDFGDDLEDPDSEWDLLFEVSKWLIDASVYEPPTTTTSTVSVTTSTLTNTTPTSTGEYLDITLISLVSVGSILIVGSVAILYRKLR